MIQTQGVAPWPLLSAVRPTGFSPVFPRSYRRARRLRPARCWALDFAPGTEQDDQINDWRNAWRRWSTVRAARVSQPRRSS